jgi:hypothetical protein
MEAAGTVPSGPAACFSFSPLLLHRLRGLLQLLHLGGGLAERGGGRVGRDRLGNGLRHPLLEVGPHRDLDPGSGRQRLLHKPRTIRADQLGCGLLRLLARSLEQPQELGGLDEQGGDRPTRPAGLGSDQLADLRRRGPHRRVVRHPVDHRDLLLRLQRLRAARLGQGHRETGGRGAGEQRRHPRLEEVPGRLSNGRDRVRRLELAGVFALRAVPDDVLRGRLRELLDALVDRLVQERVVPEEPDDVLRRGLEEVGQSLVVGLPRPRLERAKRERPELGIAHEGLHCELRLLLGRTEGEAFDPGRGCAVDQGRAGRLLVGEGLALVGAELLEVPEGAASLLLKRDCGRAELRAETAAELRAFLRPLQRSRHRAACRRTDQATDGATTDRADPGPLHHLHLRGEDFRGVDQDHLLVGAGAEVARNHVALHLRGLLLDVPDVSTAQEREDRVATEARVVAPLGAGAVGHRGDLQAFRPGESLRFLRLLILENGDRLGLLLHLLLVGVEGGEPVGGRLARIEWRGLTQHGQLSGVRFTPGLITQRGGLRFDRAQGAKDAGDLPDHRDQLRPAPDQLEELRVLGPPILGCGEEWILPIPSTVPAEPVEAELGGFARRELSRFPGALELRQPGLDHLRRRVGVADDG